MKTRIQAFKKGRRKGFTLVELIVVLVILAILAALLIPALTGYIDKAKQKQIIAQTRQAVMAAQTLYDEEYGKTKNAAGATLDNDAFAKLKSNKIKNQILILAELEKGDLTTGVLADSSVESWKLLPNITTSNGKIATLTWKPRSGNDQCVYDTSAAELYTISTKPVTP